jgi:diguanylate cyclase (GGDEF)-like protein
LKHAAAPGLLERSLASYSGAGLFLMGAAIDVALVLTHAADRGRTAALVIAGAAVVGAGIMVALERVGRISLELIYAFNVSSVVLVAALVAFTGAAQSPFPAFYMFAVVHTSAFQTRRRVAALVGLVIVLLLAPVIYDGSSPTFDALALVSVPGLVLVAGALSLAAQVNRQQQNALSELSFLDGLTGVGNYRMFWQALDAASARWRRRGEPFSLILLDINDFKPINDELGHIAGDDALRQVAAVLRDSVRTEDVVCRQGGDEFAVIASGLGAGEAAELAHRLRSAVADQVTLPWGTQLTASAGWATYCAEDSGPIQLIHRADHALRSEKRPTCVPTRLDDVELLTHAARE